MPLRFGGDAIPETFQVLQFELGAPLHVIVGSDPAFMEKHDLHWLPEFSRTVPCTHEDCPHCPRGNPVRYGWWFPCLAHTKAGNCWKQKVLPITYGMRDFLKEPKVGKIWIFERFKRPNATPKWRLSEELKNIQEFCGFDVKPSLVNMWGMFANYKNTNNPIDKDITLFDPGEAGESAAG